MAKWKIRKGLSIGQLAAENDVLLEDAFVDTGYLSQLADTNNPKFLILGRTGSGKTALIRKLKTTAERVSALHADELSLQYLHNSTMLKTVSDWGVNLDVFFKFLWRHVCILELIRLRYGESGDVDSTVKRFLESLFQPGRKETRDQSTKYLADYADQYWSKSDTRIKKIVEDVQDRLAADGKVAVGLKASGVTGEASLSGAREHSSGRTVEKEVVDRAQSVLSDFLIADLNRVVELLSTHAFSGSQRGYYIVIDDLDSDFMPDDVLYLALLKSLLIAVMELNQRLSGVKIVISLRENIYFRIFHKSTIHEPQREKWKDVQLRLRWTRSELIELVDKRLAVVFRDSYTRDVPRIYDVLPAKRRDNTEAVEYVLARTLMRPRDIIDFINTALELATTSRITWQDLFRAEAIYSKRRLESLFDEWKDSFFSLPALYGLLKVPNGRITLAAISDNDAEALLVSDYATRCSWLSRLRDDYLGDRISIVKVKEEVLRALFTVGLIGWKDPTNQVVYSFDEVVALDESTLDRSVFVLHKMFWTALGVRED